MPEASPRHRAARHRAPSKLELTRDRVCDSIADIPDRLPSGRSVAVAAVGGVLLTGAVVGAQGFVGASSDEVVAKPPMVTGAVSDAATSVSRGADRPPVAEPITDPSQLREIDRETKAAAKAEADKVAAARKAAEEERRRAAEAARDPRALARDMLADYGWSADEFGCLDALWIGESNWDPSATNPSSGAYGIPQSLPASKMASAGADWQTNPATQIRWGLGYIRDVYGTPCGAQSFKQGNGWY